jgi:DNA-binding NarL/FixJ family response regulator
MSDLARILLIDDHPAVRFGLAQLLSLDNHHICGEAGNRAEMLPLLEAGAIDLTLLDLFLGDENGLDLLDDLRQRNIPVLVYSMHEDASIIRQVFARGAQGYVCKREVSDSLREAVRVVLRGERHVSPLAAQNLARDVIGAQESENLALSERELQILELFSQGCANQEVAEKLTISVRTVESYCARVIEKLELGGMRDLRRYAIQGAHRVKKLA